jgi:hypothetical protein
MNQPMCPGVPHRHSCRCPADRVQHLSSPQIPHRTLTVREGTPSAEAAQ